MILSTNAVRRRVQICVAAVSALLLGLLAGCEEAAPLPPARDYAAEGEQWKQRIADAADRRAALTDYRFEGTITYTPPNAAKTDDPSSAGSSLSLHDGLSWSGAMYREPLQLSAELRIGGEPSQQPLPILVRDDMVYLSVPGLNAPGEFFGARLTGDEAAAEAFKGAAALDKLALAVLSRVDPLWIRSEDDNAPATANAEGPAAIVVTATEENAGHLAEAFQAAYAEWSGSFPPAFRAGLEASAPPGSRIREGVIAFDIDEAGRLANQRIDFAFETGGAGDEAAEREDAGRFLYAFSVSEANGSPAMPQTPENVIPLEHVLAFLRSSPAP